MAKQITPFHDPNGLHGDEGSGYQQSSKITLADINPELARSVDRLDRRIERLIAAKRQRGKAGPAPE